MAANVEHSSLGLGNLFKSAKMFYSQSKNNSEHLASNANGVAEEAPKTVVQRQAASVELSNPKLDKSLADSVRKVSNDPSTQASVLNKLRDSMTRSKNKYVNEILTPEAAQPEIRSGNGSVEGVKNSEDLSETCKPEICKNHALSDNLNSDKLTEIINNSIKAAVQNLASGRTCSAQSRQDKDERNVTPIESACFNNTCTQRSKSSQNKENVTSFTQCSQQAVSSTRPNLSGNVCGICPNNCSSARNSRLSYDSHQRSPPRQSPTCCVVPLSKSGISSVVCHQSVSKYLKSAYPCTKQESDKTSKSCKSCKPCKPCKPCRHVKADNRRMTGNVNIYICSEGNDGGSAKKEKKKSESTCNSMTVTNASCACSSADVCASRSTSSSKTIRNLMENRKKTEDITLKCACGKLPSNCECLPVESKNDENEPLCLCDTLSLNRTVSNETCRYAADYNIQTPSNSDPSPQGDYCVSRVLSRSSSQLREPCGTQQNFERFDGAAGLDNNPGICAEKSKLSTGNSGRGDAVRECSCCETFSNNSDSKYHVCSCCGVNGVANSSPVQNQRECYMPRNNVDYLRRELSPCDCCAYENESLYSSGKKSDFECSAVICRNTKLNKPRIQPEKKSYCTKPRDTPKSSACDSSNQQCSRYSNFCIMEEEETCDASSCNPPFPEKQDMNRVSSFQCDSRNSYSRDTDVPHDKTDGNEPRQSINGNGNEGDAEVVADDGGPASQTVTENKRISVAEVVKSYSNANKSRSSKTMSGLTPVSPLPSVSKSKSVDQSKKSLEKGARKSSLKWPFYKAKSLIGSKNISVAPKKDNSPSDTLKMRSDTPPVEPAKSVSAPDGITENSQASTEKTVNGGNSASVTKSTSGQKAKSNTDQNSSPVIKSSTGGNSLLVIKSSVSGEIKSKESVNGNYKTKLSSSRLGSLIADRKNSVHSATNETTRNSYTANQFNGSCSCGAADADMCTCQYPQCPCCDRPQEDCKCNNTQDHPQEQYCKECKQAKRLCCCCNVNNRQKKYRMSSEDSGFRVCTLCCRLERDCCCNSGSQTPRRSRSPSNSCQKTVDSYESVVRKSQICVYCEEPRDKCTCRAPIKKCSYCGMPIDVCNCQDVTAGCNACGYNENICQCNGRVVQNSGDVDQSICVTAWKPRRDVRKYFSRNPTDRESPDCSCCDTVRPYGSDELPYQRLSVFSDVMTELQQKMSELACCNRCGKIPCSCYLQECKSYSSPTNESRVCNTKQRKSRSKSPPCRRSLGASPCKCGGRNKTASYQICDHCRTTPCRCRKSRSTQRKPQAKCYYCKCSPCRCESSKAPAPKSCRCSGSSPKTQGQADPPALDKNSDRNPPSPRPRSCRCRCGSHSCGSAPRGQERPCG